MFLGHFGHNQSIFDGFSALKRKFSYFGLLGIQFKTLQSGPYSMWEDRGHHKSEKTSFLSFKNEVAEWVQDCNLSVSWSFWDVKSIFDGFRALKGNFFTF